jgi:hypothetical protein
VLPYCRTDHSPARVPGRRDRAGEPSAIRRLPRSAVIVTLAISVPRKIGAKMAEHAVAHQRLERRAGEVGSHQQEMRQVMATEFADGVYRHRQPEIRGTVADYANAARDVIQAGFDGVQILVNPVPEPHHSSPHK